VYLKGKIKVKNSIKFKEKFQFSQEKALFVSAARTGGITTRTRRTT
jgi:hypothetical protein